MNARCGSALPTPLRFVLAGGCAALANFGSRVVLSMQFPYALAIVIAYLVGMATAFVLNRRFVFQGAGNPLHHQIAWFVAINALGLLQTLAVSLLLAEALLPAAGIEWHAREIAHVGGIVAPICTSYLAHKRWTFR